MKRNGFETALFITLSTQAKLLALVAHCERGKEYLSDQQADSYKFQSNCAAVLGSVQPQFNNIKDTHYINIYHHHQM